MFMNISQWRAILLRIVLKSYIDICKTGLQLSTWHFENGIQSRAFITWNQSRISPVYESTLILQISILF